MPATMYANGQGLPSTNGAPLVPNNMDPGFHMTRVDPSIARSLKAWQATRLCLVVLGFAGVVAFLYVVTTLPDNSRQALPDAQWTRHHCFLDAEAEWSEEKKAWCCWHEGKGCNPESTGPFLCSVGLSKWKSLWSPEKKRWCCQNQQKGCPEAHALPWSCSAESVAMLTPMQKDQCCTHLGSLCSDKFNCDADLGSWKTSWSPDKKLWCCSNKAKGCN